MEETTIIITKKVPYTGSAGSPPAGDFFEGGLKYTSWKKEEFDKYNVGDTINFSYTSKDNTHEGRTFTNRNISKINEVEHKENPTNPPGYINGTIVPESEINQIMDKGTIGYFKGEMVEVVDSGSNIIKIGNLTYEVTLRLLNGIEN